LVWSILDNSGVLVKHYRDFDVDEDGVEKTSRMTNISTLFKDFEGFSISDNFKKINIHLFFFSCKILKN